MKRKLIQLSPSTSVVSMPSTWIRTNNVQKGAELEVSIEENRVCIATTKSTEKTNITLDISELNGRLMWAAIDAAYVAGYDIITLTTKDAAQTAYMTKVVRYFPGMIIYEERNNKVEFRSIGDNSDEDHAKIVNRIFNLTIAMVEDMHHAMNKDEWDTLCDAKRRDYTINSYVSYAFRFLNRNGYTPYSKLGVIHTYLKMLEMIADSIVDLFITCGKKMAPLHDALMLHLLEMLRSEQRIHTSFALTKIAAQDIRKNQLRDMSKKMDGVLATYISDIGDLFFAMEELNMQLHL